MTYNRHYCYRIDFEDGFVYFGVRSCGCDPADDTSYMGSPVAHAAKWLTDIPRVKTIVSEHETRELAMEAEDNLIRNFWAVSKPLSLNAAIHGSAFHMQGAKFTEAHRAKMSKWQKGKRRKPHTAERAAKISAANTGTKWYTDGTVSLKLKADDMIPEGFRPGKAKMSAAAAKHRANTGAAKKGSKWYTNGTKSIRLKSGSAIPEGFTPGRAKKAEW